MQVCKFSCFAVDDEMVTMGAWRWRHATHGVARYGNNSCIGASFICIGASFIYGIAWCCTVKQFHTTFHGLCYTTTYTASPDTIIKLVNKQEGNLVWICMQRCTFLLKVCQYYDFACNLRLFATFRHSAAIARCRCRVAHFPEVIATTYMNMVTTLRNISHAKNLTAGDGWCHLAISRVCLHSDKGVGLNP